MGSNDNLAYMKTMYGQNLIHIPMWMVVQDQGDNLVSFVGSSKSNEPRYGSQLIHQMIIGEVFIRPHVVIESNQYKGMGLTGLAKMGEGLQDWADKGNVLLDPMSKVVQRRKPEGVV